MNEKQLAADMSLAVLDEPPLDFDPDVVIDGAVRRRRRSRLAAASGAAAVLVAVSAVAVGHLDPPSGQSAANPRGSSPSPPDTNVPDLTAIYGPCPFSLSDVVPPLLARHFSDVEFKPALSAHTDPTRQQRFSLTHDDQQSVDVTCGTGPGVLTVWPSETSQPVIDEERPGGARLLVFVFEPEVPGTPRTIMGQWVQGNELSIMVTAVGGDKLVGTNEMVTAMTDEIGGTDR
ncbi:hypothetical protein [Actinophytocola sediminis]